jgi:two-component system response regulator HupR/HoxA
MINWKEIASLHVISKLEHILGHWFGLEILFTDHHAKVQSRHLDRAYQPRNHLFKLQLEMKYGYEYMAQDLEKWSELLADSSERGLLKETFFPHVWGYAEKIEVDGEFLGLAWAFPFVLDSITQKEKDEIIKKMVECGSSEKDAKLATDHMRRVNESELSYLKELVGLMAEEVSTYHSEISKREERIQELSSELGDKYRYHSMIGKSKNMQNIYRLLEKISGSESSVFIQGDNGTGKELVAKAIHFYSPRKDNMFNAVNCSAFNDNLLDSELFGHVKGAFTGAIKDKKGLFEQAHNGTLFLDEIGDTSLSMQVKLLRVLQEGTFMPVGATSSRKVDVRIIAATNKNIKEMMLKGEFREDLFYRINVININLPSLRDRKEDIPILIDHFMDKRCAEVGVPLKVLSKKTLEKMLDYHWPGNVRELENEVERLVVLSGQDKMVTPDLLSPRLLESVSSGPAMNSGVNTSGSLKAALEELEQLMIREGLKRCGFNKSRLAKELGISRASLIMKVEKYGLDKRKKAAGE